MNKLCTTKSWPNSTMFGIGPALIIGVVRPMINRLIMRKIAKKHLLHGLMFLIVAGGFVGCTQNGADLKFIQQVDATKNNYNASEIKNVGVNTLLEYNRSYSHSNSIFVPKKISSLPLFSEDPSNTVSANIYLTHRGNCIIGFVVNGGFSAQGIFICPTNSEEEKEFLKEFTGTIVPWQNGVYFWASWEVVKYREYWNNPP